MLEHLYSSDVNARLTIPEFTHKESKLQSPSYHAPPPTVAAPWLAPSYEPRCYYVRVLGLILSQETAVSQAITDVGRTISVHS